MSGEILGSRVEGSTLIVETADGAQSYDSRFLVAAFLIDVARGSGQIEPEESSQIIDLIETHFHLEGAESLDDIGHFCWIRQHAATFDERLRGITGVDTGLRIILGHAGLGHEGHLAADGPATSWLVGEDGTCVKQLLL